ncbi:MAG: hypothetical protein LBJ20_08240 [Candidatus Methanoplasma sp.]|nr:hypothetical protein [Candidatus Methanoplasma sp.]
MRTFQISSVIPNPVPGVIFIPRPEWGEQKSYKARKTSTDKFSMPMSSEKV